MREAYRGAANISFYSSAYHYQAAVDRPEGITLISERFAGWAGEYPSASVVYPYHRETKVQDYFCSKCEKKEYVAELAAILLLADCPHNRNILRAGRKMAGNDDNACYGADDGNACYDADGENACCGADVLVGRKVS
jgi:hypothetical protein